MWSRQGKNPPHVAHQELCPEWGGRKVGTLAISPLTRSSAPYFRSGARAYDAWGEWGRGLSRPSLFLPASISLRRNLYKNYRQVFFLPTTNRTLLTNSSYIWCDFSLSVCAGLKAPFFPFLLWTRKVNFPLFSPFPPRGLSLSLQGTRLRELITSCPLCRIAKKEKSYVGERGLFI